MPIDRRSQYLVAAGIIIAAIVSGLFIYSAQLWAVQHKFLSHLSAQQGAALAMGIAAIAIVASIGWAAALRFFVSNIDGSKPQDGTVLELALRNVTNTTEQVLLFSLAAVCVSASTPTLEPAFLPIMAVWFVLARIMFVVGYHVHPLARALGFAATFYPSVGILIYGVWRFLR